MGCAWLLDRWGELRDVLEAGQKWQAPDRFKAIRLLGRQPLDMDEDARVMAIYLRVRRWSRRRGWRSRTWATSCTGTSRSGSTSGLGERGVLGLPADAETGKAALLELVGEEEGRLEERLTTLLEGPEPSGGSGRSTPATRPSGCAGTRRHATERCSGSWRRCGSVVARRTAPGANGAARPDRQGTRPRTRSAGSAACWI